MKILIVQDFLRSGGTERQSVLLANAFTQAGHPTTLLTFRPGGALAETVAAAVTRITLQPIDTRLDWFAPRLLSRAAQARPDVILCMGRMANCYAGALQKRVSGAVVIATLRTGKPLPWLFQQSLQRVRSIVANSRDARDRLVGDYGIPAAKIVIIYNSLVFRSESGGDRGLLPAASLRLEARARAGATDATTILLCVAMFRPEKNQRELIEIAAGFPAGFDWQLWLAGDGVARSDCEQLTQAKELGDRVKFPGWVRDPSALYRAADIAVHASSSESLSNFLIEAQAHGLPAVAYAAQGISETFVPGETGWEIPCDDRSQFRAIVQTLAGSSAAERDERSRAAKQFARETFDPARQVASYLELFHRLCREANHDEQATH